MFFGASKRSRSSDWPVNYATKKTAYYNINSVNKMLKEIMSSAEFSQNNKALKKTSVVIPIGFIIVFLPSSAGKQFYTESVFSFCYSIVNFVIFPNLT